jgi:hypothetical protein
MALVSEAEENMCMYIYIYTVRPTRGQPQKMLVYKRDKSTIHLHVIPVLKCGCVFWEFTKRKLATRKDKIKIIESLPLALSVSREERCEVLACFHVVVKMYWYSLEEWVFIKKTYWITGSIKICQRRFVEQFGGPKPALEMLHSTFSQKAWNQRNMAEGGQKCRKIQGGPQTLMRVFSTPQTCLWEFA